MLQPKKVISAFQKNFGKCKFSYFTSPGRINLIGEHTDYNGGFVLPAAVDKGISVAIAPNGSTVVNAYSMDYGATVTFDVNAKEKPAEQWACYIYGVIQEMKERGAQPGGFNCAFGGDVPLGAGMSSSAALESVFGYALNTLFHCGFKREELAKIGQMTEHHYIGVNCGIMDQFASLMGKEGKVIRLDCRSLSYKRVPFNPKGYKIVLIDTMVKHNLAAGEYNVRRAQCEAGVAAIKKDYPEVELLRDVTPAMLEQYKDVLEPIVYKRCSFVVKESPRLLAGCKDLAKGDIPAFGAKMFETHDGLSKDYGVSCEELDFIVDIARKTDGVVGARMMGGGFGGCVIAIVRSGAAKGYIEAVKKAYLAKFNKDPRVINVAISDGAKRWNVRNLK
ncbi:MAG: galactokinase [Bacteroidales bacterium]|nr:galactokinase [Candidatus Equibacterium intestinale]